MKLGNSNGNNRGKKYIMHRSLNQATPEEQNRTKADHFAQWFGQSYESVVLELCQKDIYDDDTLGNTFIKVYDNVLHAGLDIEHYRAYFMRAYFTNLIQGHVQQNRFSSISMNYDAPDNEGYNPEIDRAHQLLEEDIFTYVYNRYRTREFELFKMYMSLKPAINYGTLSEITSIKAHQIQFIISKIKKDICQNREFAVRRKALVG